MDTISTGRRTAASRSVLLDPVPRPISLGSRPSPVPSGRALRGPVVRPEPAPGPRRADALSVAVLEDLLALPGALYACFARLADGEILVGAGRSGAEARGSVRHLTAAVRVALRTFVADPGDLLDDFVVTSSRCYDLVRQVPGSGTVPTQVLYLQVDRDQGNLAQARHRLAAADPLPARPPSLPRRVPQAVQPALDLDAVDRTSSAVPTGWANDLATLRRLGTALRCSA
jgi:hypothetical protein